MTDRAGRGPLHYAALENRPRAIQDLLAAGEEVDAGDKLGFTALHFAAQQAALESAQVLISAGSDVNAVNRFGNTPLFIAVFASHGQGAMITFLRECGGNPRVANNSGQTPLGLARLIGNYDVAQFFDDLS